MSFLKDQNRGKNAYQSAIGSRYTSNKIDAVMCGEVGKRYCEKTTIRDSSRKKIC